MTDRADDHSSAPVPMVWALVVRPAADDEPPQEQPVAEAVVQFDPARHPVFVSDALDSGLLLAAGHPPTTTAVVHVRDHRLTKLVLVGGREHWEPDLPVEVSAGWLEAARARGRVVLIVVPPGTWPGNLPELAPELRDDIFTAALENAYAAGQVLHGTVRLVEDRPEGPSDGPGTA